MELLEIFKEIYHIPGISGHEDKVASKIKEILAKYGKLTTGGFGSIVCHMAGPEGQENPRIIICAHMDTPGFMVKSFGSNGNLKVARLGLKDMRALHQQRVVIHSQNRAINGVFISERDENFYIETGYKTEELKKAGVQVGDPVTFFPTLVSLSDSKYMSPFIDNRLGLAILIYLAEKLQSSGLPLDVYLVASTQEEWGGNGALTTTRQIKPDFGIVFDVTWVADHVVDGSGPVLTLLDRTIILPDYLRKNIIKLAEKAEIPLQTEVYEVGGSDAGSVGRALTGTPVICILPPTRHSHSAVEIFDIRDAENTVKLTLEILRNLKDLTI